jgi:hypothetical protein
MAKGRIIVMIDYDINLENYDLGTTPAEAVEIDANGYTDPLQMLDLISSTPYVVVGAVIND